MLGVRLLYKEMVFKAKSPKINIARSSAPCSKLWSAPCENQRDQELEAIIRGGRPAHSLRDWTMFYPSIMKRRLPEYAAAHSLCKKRSKTVFLWSCVYTAKPRTNGDGYGFINRMPEAPNGIKVVNYNYRDYRDGNDNS